MLAEAQKRDNTRALGSAALYVVRGDVLFEVRAEALFVEEIGDLVYYPLSNPAPVGILAERDWEEGLSIRCLALNHLMATGMCLPTRSLDFFGPGGDLVAMTDPAWV